jgi:hypothetical protein
MSFDYVVCHSVKSLETGKKSGIDQPNFGQPGMCAAGGMALEIPALIHQDQHCPDSETRRAAGPESGDHSTQSAKANSGTRSRYESKSPSETLIAQPYNRVSSTEKRSSPRRSPVSTPLDLQEDRVPIHLRQLHISGGRRAH